MYSCAMTWFSIVKRKKGVILIKARYCVALEEVGDELGTLCPHFRICSKARNVLHND